MSKSENINEQFISDRELRDKYVNRFEVLEKVKDLLLLPEVEMMSINQVADYYEVSPEWIKELYGSHREEIDSDGTTIIPRNYYDGSKLEPTSIKRKQTSVTYTFDNGQIITINNRGLKAFSKRAVLRIGMMLQQSNVAMRVRTALLDIEEKVSDEIKTQDINEEQRLMLNIGMAYASGNVDAIMRATTEYNAFQNRHIEKLKQDNKALSGEILSWSDRSKLNSGIRTLSKMTHIHYAELWNELYRNLQYKYSIALKMRGKSPYIQHIKENEWDKVIKTFSALCEAYGYSPTDMIRETVMLNA